MSLKMKYFVLNPQSSNDARALASREAIIWYSHFIAGADPQLADDLRQWMEHLELNDNREVPPPDIVITLNRAEAQSLIFLLKAHALKPISANFADQLYAKMLHSVGVIE